ncbi:M48 family metallopeptidase [Ponticaulis profundi]|uniref:M48 family metallopeptidase n=1 Tax=Ponticaulis profundi TaxID=2665222 RepID=A0ABW1SEK1_9PROT
MRLSDETISNEELEKAPRIALSRREIITGLAVGSVVPIVSGCTTNPATGRSQFLLVDEGTVAQMAESAWTEMKQQTPISRNSSLNSRVNRVWEKISVGAGRSNEHWDVEVFDTDDVNAFVMPGNKVGVYRGITELVENDDQLSSVLGHEVGHVVGKHAAERYSVQMAGQLAVVAGAIAVNQSDTLKKYGNEIGALGGAALQFGVLLPYSRNHELEADRLGVDYMHKVGFKVAEAPKLWDLMAARSSGSSTPEFMSTHPAPQRRASELRQYINARGYDLV